jgi:hypothetical protein
LPSLFTTPETTAVPDRRCSPCTQRPAPLTDAGRVTVCGVALRVTTENAGATASPDGIVTHAGEPVQAGVLLVTFLRRGGADVEAGLGRLRKAGVGCSTTTAAPARGDPVSASLTGAAPAVWCSARDRSVRAAGPGA